MNEKKCKNKRNVVDIISIVSLISNLIYFFKSLEIFHIIASWSFCLWIIFVCYYWIIKSLYIKKLVLTYILIIADTVVGWLLYSRTIINNEIEILFIFLSVLLFKDIRALLNKLDKMETIGYSELRIECFRYSENMLSFYLFVSMVLIQMMVACFNGIWIKALILLVFYTQFLWVSIKKCITLRRNISRVIVEDILVLIEIIVSIIFENGSFDLYIFICEFICWLPFLSGFLLESVKNNMNKNI